MTLRELAWMADGKQGDAWNHTACLLAQIHNANPFARDHAKPADYLPERKGRTNGQAREMSLGEAAEFFGSR